MSEDESFKPFFADVEKMSNKELDDIINRPDPSMIKRIEIFFPYSWSIGEANKWLRANGFPPFELISIEPQFYKEPKITLIGHLFTFEGSFATQSSFSTELLIHKGADVTYD